jgi:lipid-binding SYLF domain-containing protein
MIRNVSITCAVVLVVIGVSFVQAQQTYAFENRALAQKQGNKFPDAIERSGDAARIVSMLALLPDSGFPKELVDKAMAVGVFPKVTRETTGFTHLTQGYGVISARQENGWTSPAFYQFMGGGYGSPFAKEEKNGVILLFMTKDAVSWFEKGGVPLKNEKKAIPGPVGAMAEEQRQELEGAQILAYAYYNGKLNGTAFGKSFWKKFLLDPDNNINKPLYGMKGREVLAGQKIDSQTLPAGISAFQEALTKYYAKP